MRHLQKIVAVPGIAALALLTSVALAQEVAEEVAHPSGHTTMEAPPELVALVRSRPDQFVGKELVLDDGVNMVTVGPVLALRTRIVDQEPYLIVDATSYFNTPTQYAVAVKDIDRIEAGTLVTPEAAGMHLRGLEYYADEFVDLKSTEEVLAEQAETEAAAEAAERLER